MVRDLDPRWYLQVATFTLRNTIPILWTTLKVNLRTYILWWFFNLSLVMAVSIRPAYGNKSSLVIIQITFLILKGEVNLKILISKVRLVKIYTKRIFSFFLRIWLNNGCYQHFISQKNL